MLFVVNAMDGYQPSARVWFPAQNVTEDLSFILGAGSGQTPGGRTINNLGIVESSV